MIDATKPLEQTPFSQLAQKNAELRDRLQQLPIGQHQESMFVADLLLEVIELQGQMFAALRSQSASHASSITKLWKSMPVLPGTED